MAIYLCMQTHWMLIAQSKLTFYDLIQNVIIFHCDCLTRWCHYGNNTFTIYWQISSFCFSLKFLLSSKFITVATYESLFSSVAFLSLCGEKCDVRNLNFLHCQRKQKRTEGLYAEIHSHADLCLYSCICLNALLISCIIVVRVIVILSVLLSAHCNLYSKAQCWTSWLVFFQPTLLWIAYTTGVEYILMNCVMTRQKKKDGSMPDS